MKRIVSLLLGLFVANGLIAQTNDCLTFEDPGVAAGWSGYNVGGPTITSGGPGHPFVMQFTDGSGGSIAFNQTKEDLQGNWMVRFGPCPDTLYLSFWFRVDWNTDVIWDPIPAAPKFWIYGFPPLQSVADFNSRVKAGFRPNPVNPPYQLAMEDNVWRKYVIPCIPCTDADVGLPSNSLGRWEVADASGNIMSGQPACDAWNEILQNVAGIAFPTDYNQQPSEVIQIDSICWTCAVNPCDTVLPPTITDSACCTFNVPIHMAIPDLLEIRYEISGGMITGLSSTGGCASTWTSLTNTEGMLTFTQPCTVTNINLVVDVLPFQDPATINWVITHSTGQVCYGTSEVSCEVYLPPQCDVITSGPVLGNEFPGRGRSITIRNTKYPASDICSVDVHLEPSPLPNEPNNQWLGGAVLTFTDPNGFESYATWMMQNSGTPYYSHINVNGQSGSYSQPIPTNGAIEFSVGVNYTLSWEGNVRVTVTHCDGTTCEEVIPMCALMPEVACIPEVNDVDISTMKMAVPGPLRGGLIGINVPVSKMISDSTLRDQVSRVQLHVLTPSGAQPDEIFGLGRRRLRGKMGSWAGFRVTNVDIQDDHAMLYLSRGLTDTDTLEIPMVVMLGEDRKEVRVAYTLMYTSGQPLLTDTFALELDVSSIGGSVDDGLAPQIMNTQPNPTTSTVNIRYWMPTATEHSFSVTDVLSRPLKTVTIHGTSAGEQTYSLPLDTLPAGSYFITLNSSFGSSTRLITIVR